MIRPLTIVTLCAAAAAGVWLYQVKHSVAQLDRELREINRRTEQVRERTQVLRAEWALLNEPDRLRQVVQRHLPLEPMTPAQFVRLSEAERRLPSPRQFAGAPSLFAPVEPVGDGSPTGIALAAAVPRHAIAPTAAGVPAAPEAQAAAAMAVAPAAPAVVAAPPAAPTVVAAATATPDTPPAARAPRTATPRANATRPPAPPQAAPQPVVQRAVHVARRDPAPPPRQVSAGIVRPAVASSLGGAGMAALAPPVPVARAAAATLPPGTPR